LVGAQYRVLKPGGQARVDFVVPAAADAPARLALGIGHFPGDLVSGGSFPAAGLEIQGAGFVGGVVCDFHGAVVVHGGVAGDDADDGGGYFLPCVEFFPAGGGAEFEEPGSQRVYIERLAVEFGFYC